MLQALPRSRVGHQGAVFVDVEGLYPPVCPAKLHAAVPAIVLAVTKATNHPAMAHRTGDIFAMLVMLQTQNPPFTADTNNGRAKFGLISHCAHAERGLIQQECVTRGLERRPGWSPQ